MENRFQVPETDRCHIFSMEDPKEAYEATGHADIVQRWPDLYDFDDGCRNLCCCKTCGRYFLAQYSEYHGFDDDSFYADYYPVSGPDMAQELAAFSPLGLESTFSGKWLSKTNSKIYWRENI